MSTNLHSLTVQWVGGEEGGGEGQDKGICGSKQHLQRDIAVLKIKLHQTSSYMSSGYITTNTYSIKQHTVRMLCTAKHLAIVPT